MANPPVGSKANPSQFDVIDKLGADVPKYPMLALARKKWTGED